MWQFQSVLLVKLSLRGKGTLTIFRGWKGKYKKGWLLKKSDMHGKDMVSPIHMTKLILQGPFHRETEMQALPMRANLAACTLISGLYRSV